MNDALLKQHLVLALVSGLGPKLTRALLDWFGTPAAVLDASVNQLEAVPQVGKVLAEKFHKGIRNAKLDAEWNLLNQHGVKVFVNGHDGYPPRLTTLDNAPHLLYCKGEMLPTDEKSIGIVGSRSCTGYGKRMTQLLAEGLARLGWTVISGLARGIDGVAHQAALDAGGRTIAVLANGLSTVYPPEHKDLAQAVASRGAVITETPMTVAPQAGMFPARNRIISGLSRAVVVVEANARSGALITATHAAEQGREVFAYPGNADSTASAGCLELIRKGVRLIRNLDDLLEDLQGLSVPRLPPPKKGKRISAVQRNVLEDLEDEPAPMPEMTAEQQSVWTILSEAKYVDELIRELNKSSAEVTKLLMTMEMKRLVRRLPGNQYERRAGGG
jgi:DNA processing protein